MTSPAGPDTCRPQSRMRCGNWSRAAWSRVAGLPGCAFSCRRGGARGAIGGGRFGGGFMGEQYALPEAVDALRTVRRSPPSGELVLVSTADPLNLVGIILPGGRVSPFANQIQR